MRTIRIHLARINIFFKVDFANKVIGGGVIGSGCVQEEIRFMICPGKSNDVVVIDSMREGKYHAVHAIHFSCRVDCGPTILCDDGEQ